MALLGYIVAVVFGIAGSTQPGFSEAWWTYLVIAVLGLVVAYIAEAVST
jgi:hypothetical protein